MVSRITSADEKQKKAFEKVLRIVHCGPRTDEHGLTVPSFHVIVAVGFRTQYEIASFCSGVRGGACAEACAVVPEAGETEETGTARVEGVATGVEVDGEAGDIGEGGV